MEGFDAQVHRIVAFDKKGKPIRADDHDWEVSVDVENRTLNVSCRKVDLSWDLRADLVAARGTGEVENVAITRTIGRAALTGVATQLIARGGLRTGVGASLLDLGFRGLEQNTSGAVALIFRDTSVIELLLEEDELEELCALCPKAVFTDEAYQTANSNLSLVTRMVADGDRILGEIEQKLETLHAELEAIQHNIEAGGSFDVRDAARSRVRGLEAEIELTSRLQEAVEYQFECKRHYGDDENVLMTPPKKKKEKTNIVLYTLVVLVVSFLIAAAAAPADKVGPVFLSLIGAFVLLRILGILT